MAIIFYISFLLSPRFLLYWLTKRFGRFPKSRVTVVWRALPAVLVAFCYFAIFMFSWGSEGTNSSVFVFCGINTAIVLAGFRGRKLWSLSFLVFFYSLSLDLFHTQLARSPNYTDAPTKRLARIARQNRNRARRGQPLLPDVEITPEWHTGLTQLYVVRPKP